jgi:hypothetical protein
MGRTDEGRSEVKTSEAVDQIYVAIFDLQQALAPVKRDKVVKVKTREGSYEFRYAPLDSIMDVLKPLFQKTGLALIQGVDRDCLTTRVIHKSGQWIESDTFLNAEHANMQGFGGEVTYKRRYALSALLGIVSDEDNDVPRISATKGVLETLTQKRQSALADIAEYIKEKHAAEDEWAAYEEYGNVVDQDERIALWNLLPSQVRTSITKLSNQERQGAKA